MDKSVSPLRQQKQLLSALTASPVSQSSSFSSKVCCSYGIACFYEDNGAYKLLFGERPFTYAFMEWVYHVVDDKYTDEMLCREIDKMTELEKQHCCKLQVDALHAITKCYNDKDDMSKAVIFTRYKTRMLHSSTKPNFILDYIKNRSPFEFKTEKCRLDLPKGRKKKDKDENNKKTESDQSCAIREFKEETG